MALSVSPIAADDFEHDRRTLKGIQSMAVWVVELDPDAGLTVDQIRTDVELKLRLAGIKIDPRSNVRLCIKIVALLGETVSGRPTGNYCFYVHVGFEQMAYLARDLSVLTIAETWSVGGVVTGSSSPFKVRCRETVRGFVDNFVNAYLSVNPK
jgi:hypothetical protein